MKRKRLLLILGCLAAVLLAGYATLLVTGPRHRISEGNFAAIEKGMTEKEVEAILGASAGDYSSGKVIVLIVGALQEDEGTKEWVGDDCCVAVRFQDGRVVETTCWPVAPMFEESFVTKLRRWLGM